MSTVLASLEDDATGLVSIQTGSPGSGAVASSVLSKSFTAPVLTTQAPSTGSVSTGSAPSQATGAAFKVTGGVGRELLFGAAGAIGAGVFGL